MRTIYILSAILSVISAEFVLADVPPTFSVTLPGVGHQYSSPAIGKLIPGSVGDQIVVVSGAVVYALGSDGAVLWSSALPIASCTATSDQNKVYATPAIADLRGDGTMSVIAAYGGYGGTACGGGVVALDGATGARLWLYDLKVAAKKLKFGTRTHAVFSSPIAVDLDGDGKREVAFGSWDRNIYVLNSDGTLRWYYQAADTVWSSPAAAEIGGKRGYELIVGTDISKNPRLKPPTFDGGFLYAFNSKQKSKKVGFRNKAAYLWQTFADQVFYASPVVGDLIASSPGPEIAIASGCFFPQGRSPKRGRTLKVYSGTSGKLLTSLDVPSCSTSHPAIADLNGDGALELVFPANGDGSSLGTLYAWTPSTNNILWSITPAPAGKNDSDLGTFNTPVIADIDGNGSLEVVVNGGAGLSIFVGDTGASLSCSTSSCNDGLPHFDLGGSLHTSPAVGDLNGDGILELVAVSYGTGGRTVVRSWSGLNASISSSAGVNSPYTTTWSQYHGRADHAGCYGDASICPKS